MKRIYIPLTALLLLVTALPLRAQLQFDILSTDGSAYPEIGVVFEAKDGAGKAIINYQPSDFTVVENGIVRPVKSVSCPPPVTPQVSITFTFDVSFSMSIDNRLANLQSASTQLVSDLSYPPAASVITSFDDDSRILTPYTSNKADILNTISALTASGGGTDFEGAFLDAGTGAIDVTKNRPGDRYIVFMTDAFQGLTTAIENQIINAANAANIRVYTITVSPNTVNLSLRRIANRTGGRWFEDVLTAQEAKNIFDQIGSEIFIYPPCTLIYETDGCDTERSLSVTLRKIGDVETRTSTVSINPNDIVALNTNVRLLDFGLVPAGQSRTDNIVLRAQGTSIHVTSITTTDASFRILDYGGSAPPFDLAAGSSRTLRIQFRPVVTDRITAELEIVSDAPCGEGSSLAGGSYDPAPLRLIQPNGGEKLFSGTFFRTEWTGISSTQVAELEYSTDAGSSWTSITDNVYNFVYNWRVPDTPSDECLGFVLTREERIASIDNVWAGLQPDAINEIAVAPSGVLSAAALANGQIKLFYPKDATYISLIDAHSSSVNTIDFSPDVKYLASGGSDGNVRIWDTRTGNMIKELTQLSGPVHSLRFSADGNYLVGASSNNIVLWQVWSWTPAWTNNSDTNADGAVAISPNLDFVASARGNGIAILDFSGGARQRTLSGHSGAVRALDISNDGLLIASGSDDRTVRLWNTLKWEQSKRMNGHSGSVRSVSLANGGTRVISAAADNTVRIWDGRDGAALHTFSGHSATVQSAAFDRKTKLVLSGGNDRTIRAWGYVPPLGDKSDSLFTIISTVTDIKGNPPRFEDLKCPDTWSDDEAVIVNTGNQDVTVSGLRITGTDKDAFSVIGGFTIPPDVLMKPEDTLRIPLRFFPTRVGDFDAVLELDTDVPGSPLVTLPLSGHKDSIRSIVFPDTVDVGELYACALPVEFEFILANEGDLPVIIDSLDSDLGTTVSFTGSLSRTLLPGQRDTLRGYVHPSVHGPFEGYVRLETTPCGFTEDIIIRGNMVPTALVANPNPVIFDFAAVGDTSFTQVVLHNPTITDMILDSLAFLISTPPFAVLDSMAWLDSLALPDTLAPGDSIVFRLAFFPTSEGDASGAMFFHTTFPCDDSLLVPLIASSSRKPQIAQTAEEFPSLLCPEEQTSHATATLRNTGGLPLTISELRFEGTHPGDFSVLSPSTPLTIDPGGSETVQLEFNYGAVGSDRSAILVVLSNAENTPRLEIPFTARKDSANVTWTVTDHDFGELYECEFPQTVDYVFSNTGTVDATVDIDVSGVPEGFSYDNVTVRTIAPGATETFTVTLLPTAYGNYAADLAYTAQPCDQSGQMTSITYSYAPHAPEVLPLMVDFGTLGIGANATDVVTIRNPQQRPMRVQWNALSDPNLSILSPITRDTTLAGGESVTITLRMDALTDGDITDLLRIFTTQACDDSATVSIAGRVDAATSAISVPSLEGEIGTYVTIPMRLDNAVNLALTGTRSFTADLVFNRSMLWPEDISSNTGTANFTATAEGNDLRVSITVDQPSSPSTGVLVELRCLVLLGNADNTPLLLENFAWTEGIASSTTTDGSFMATGICDAGGQRLIALPSTVSLFQNTPNPFNPTTEIAFFLPEEAAVNLRVYDMLGREIDVLAEGLHSAGVHRVQFDGAGLESGSYFAVLRSGDEVRVKRMILMK
ncbi:choice-of-anchor D domain-containing protein [bacterium]|nr:choice-of-anchor D domain-containing protein [bacterium]